jgi:hypothetical protein
VTVGPSHFHLAENCWLALVCSTGIGYDCGSYQECGGENDEPEPEPGNTHHHESLVAGLAIGGVVLLLLGGLGLFLRARRNMKSPLEQSLNAAIQSERH